MTAGSSSIVKVSVHGAPELRAVRNEVLYVYEAAWSTTAFALSPFQLRDFEGILERHRTRKSFRLATAREESGELVGFAYGYTSERGGWWRDIVTDALDDAVVEEWFSDCFEFVELAVHPGAQARGVGSSLHDALLGGIPHRTSALSTQSTNEAALRLYRGRGWIVLEPEFMFPNRSYSFTIMGLDLAAHAARSTRLL